eukprot:NODE_148_length_17471_cov_0.413136.p3 type:complete len:492 gc:universal NODE_148_length_17471_cov_0.413136:11062-9587(-)
MSYFESSNYDKIKSVVTAYFKNPDKSLKNILLFGIPGSGKTSSVVYLCKQMRYELRYVSQETIASSYGGQPESNLRDAIYGNQIKSVESRISNIPHAEFRNIVVLIDEIDSMDGYVLNTLINIIDEQPSNMFIIGATNLSTLLNPQLSRYGRFDLEIHMEPLSKTQRVEFLKVNNTPHDLIHKLLPYTGGCVFADLLDLCRLIKKFQDFSEILMHFKPSLLRNAIEFYVEVNDLPNIIGYQLIKDKIEKYVIQPYHNPEKYSKFNMHPIKGLLLYGPPGCSKTQFAKYIAYKLKSRFFVASCAQIVSPYTGEAERKLRSLFNRARLAGPSILFFDEIEALVGKRGHGESFQEKIVITFLTELDGIESCTNVLLIGATNRPDQIDSALLRPGRMEKLLYVGLPDARTRLQILKFYSNHYNANISTDMIIEISSRCDGFSGAQLQGLIKSFVTDVVIAKNIKNYQLDDFIPFIKNQKRKDSTSLNVMFKDMQL